MRQLCLLCFILIWQIKEFNLIKDYVLEMLGSVWFSILKTALIISFQQDRIYSVVLPKLPNSSQIKRKHSTNPIYPVCHHNLKSCCQIFTQLRAGICQSTQFTDQVWRCGWLFWSIRALFRFLHPKSSVAWRETIMVNRWRLATVASDVSNRRHEVLWGTKRSYFGKWFNLSAL